MTTMVKITSIPKVNKYFSKPSARKILSLLLNLELPIIDISQVLINEHITIGQQHECMNLHEDGYFFVRCEDLYDALISKSSEIEKTLNYRNVTRENKEFKFYIFHKNECEIIGEKHMKKKLRITTMPPGFPPEQIREHWVGIEIPLADPNQPFGEENAVYYNPLSMDEVPEHVGYEINAYHALQELYKKKPEFEEWFINQGLNAGPESVGQAFGQWSFAAHCCELID